MIAVFSLVFGVVCGLVLGAIERVELRDEAEMLRQKVADLERQNLTLRETTFRGVSRFQDIIDRMDLDK